MKRASRSNHRATRKKNPRGRTRLIALALLALALLLLIVIRERDRKVPPPTVSESDSAGPRVIDGDTFVRSDGTKVRLLGIDTPEKGEPLYEEATQYLKLLIANQELRYLFGPERTDRYGRTLAFVYAGTTFVNGALVRSGLARSYIFSDELLLMEVGQSLCEAQWAALNEGRGIWSVKPPEPETRYFGNPRSLRFHRPDCSSIRNSDTLEFIRATAREELLKQCLSPCRNCDP